MLKNRNISFLLITFLGILLGLNLQSVAASFTENLYKKIDQYGTLVLEDISTAYSKSVSSAKKLAQCPYGECCIPHYVTADFDGLQKNLQRELFGQHLVQELIVKSLNVHYNQKKQSGKPLVISLQGQSGTGKTYVSEKIASFTYKLGLKSTFVHHYTGRTTFPLVKDLEVYKERIAREVKEGVKSCSRSMFIYDEVDKMPAGIFDSIGSVLNHNQRIDGVDYRQATFIFISNSHGIEVAQRLQSLEQTGVLREDTKLSDFEDILKLIAYNGGALEKSSIIQEDLIDHYVPFLPLEKKHVEQCVRHEFRRHNITKIDDDIVRQIVTESTTYNNAYSISGCKRIDKTVALYASDL